MSMLRTFGDNTLNIDVSDDDNLTQQAIRMRNYAYLGVIMPALWTAASLGFKVSNTSNGTFVALYDQDGVLVQIDSPSAALAYVAPPEVAAWNYVKLWSQDGAASDEAQAADRIFLVGLKS